MNHKSWWNYTFTLAHALISRYIFGRGIKEILTTKSSKSRRMKLFITFNKKIFTEKGYFTNSLRQKSSPQATASFWHSGASYWYCKHWNYTPFPRRRLHFCHYRTPPLKLLFAKTLLQQGVLTSLKELHVTTLKNDLLKQWADSKDFLKNLKLQLFQNEI